MGFEAAEPVFDVFGFIELWYGGGHGASFVLPPRRDGLAFALGKAVIDMVICIGGADLLVSRRLLFRYFNSLISALS